MAFGLLSLFANRTRGESRRQGRRTANLSQSPRGRNPLPQKATAARVPTPKAAASSSVSPETGPPTLESIGRQLRELFPNRRLHSISLCDREANCLWLSEGALGPDEHSLITEALEQLAGESASATHEISLEDGRFAMFLAVRDPASVLVGVAMILADGKSPGEETHERLSAAPMRALLIRLAVLMKRNETAPAAEAKAPAAPTSHAAAVTAAPAEMSAQQVNDILELDFALESPMATPKAPAVAPESTASVATEDPEPFTLAEYSPPKAPAAPSAPTLAPPPVEPPVLQAPALIAPVRPAAPVRPVRPAAAAPAAAPTLYPVPPPGTVKTAPVVQAPIIVPVAPSIDPTLLLEVLPFGKLRAGGQTRRFQVLPRVAAGSRDPAAIDALILQRLMAWLAGHRPAWSSQPTGFTVSLSVASLEDERFAQKASAALNAHGISPETLGFEITEALCTQRRAQVERFLAQCEKVGSWVVIDDFSFDSQVLPLVRSKAVRLVKMDAKLTSSALKDKLCQALVVATVQAAKVLGIHCAAKKVDSQAALQWLTAIGCDFAQGAALAGTQTLDSLAPPPVAALPPRPGPRPA
jgi:EAL domain-containing protein (putative c-di-GMP-specific phosphodiesterase class I)